MITLNRLDCDALIPALVTQILPGRSVVRVESVPEGVSTYVYRILCDGELFYLRVLPEVNASFAPEALVHDLLRAKNIAVPAVLYVEPCNPLVGRSLLLTTAIRGRPVSHNPSSRHVGDSLFQAGKELAVINSIPVTGFGWIRRDEGAGARLLGEFATFQEWMQQELDDALIAIQQASILPTHTVGLIRTLMAHADGLFAAEPPCLAHGDFDVSHIFQDEDRYTGIIDFGEIRGAPALYDLGHFQIECADLLPDLLAGYTAVHDLPYDYAHRIRLLSLLIAVGRVGRRAIKRPGDLYDADLLAIRHALHGLTPSLA